MPGYFGGACANCIWSDHGSRCSVYDANDNDHPDPSSPLKPCRRPDQLGRRQITAGSLKAGPTAA